MKGVLLGNAPSSGSTLLSVILNSHPDIVCGPELDMFAHPYFWKLQGDAWRQAASSFIQGESQPEFPERCPFAGSVTKPSLEWYQQDESTLLDAVSRSANGSELAAAFYAARFRQDKKSIWAEKSPPNLYAIPSFLGQNEEHRAIIVVRHGLDVAVSLMNNRGYSFREAAKIWAFEASLSRQIYERDGGERVFLLRYEDLVGQPENELGRLCAFLEIPEKSEDMLAYHRNSSRLASDPTIDETKGEAASRWRHSPRQAISSKSCGQWEGVLKERHLDYFLSLVVNDKVREIDGDFLPARSRETMEFFDYSPAHRPTAVIRLLPEEDSVTGAKLPQGEFLDSFVDFDNPVCDDQSIMTKAKSPEKPKALILAYSPIARDARVLRQARYLAPHYDLTLAGFGENPFANDDSVDLEWIEIETSASVPKHAILRRRIFAWLSRISGRFAHAYSLEIAHLRYGWHVAQSRKYRLILCNDVDALPAGVAAIEANKSCKLVLDLHEYPTREMTGGGDWRWERKPLVTGILKRMARKAHGTVTVADSFASLMQKEFRMKKPIIVRSAPELVDVSRGAKLEGEKIHLIHHGAAMPAREPERLIKACRQLDERYVLHLMLTGSNEYIAELKQFAEQTCPGRVHFEDPVKPNEIVSAISRFDMGLYILPPVSFNDLHAMPNKFFDFIVAGLAVATAPSVNMAKITRDNDIGWVADDFEPATMANRLNALSKEDIEKCRANALKLREKINAKTELEKLVDLCKKVTHTE